MKTSVSVYDFKRYFHESNHKEDFSKSGLVALFDYLEELEQGTDEDMELDVIAICCDFAEYDSAQDCCAEMACIDIVKSDLEGLNGDEVEEYYIEKLQEHTAIICGYDGYKIIIQNF